MNGGIDDAHGSGADSPARLVRAQDDDARTQRDRRKGGNARGDQRPRRQAPRHRGRNGLLGQRTSGQERLVLPQDRRLELAQFLAGLEPELLLEHAAPGLVRVECVGLPARAIEGEHQLAADPLAIGVFRDQRFELGHECGIASECEIRVDSFFERSQAELLQLGDGGGRERLGPAAPGAGRPARA